MGFDYDYNYYDGMDNVWLCEFVENIVDVYFISPYVVCNIIFSLVLGFLATIGMRKIHQHNPNANLTLVLYLATLANFIVTLEVTFSGLFLLFGNMHFNLHWEVSFYSGVTIFQLCEIETILIYFLIALQRYLAWSRPISFINQSKLFLICQIAGAMIVTHILIISITIPYVFGWKSLKWYHFHLHSEWVSLIACTIVIISTIALHIYVGTRPQWRVENLLNPESAVQYSVPLDSDTSHDNNDDTRHKISIQDEHNENGNESYKEEEKERQSAVPRLMMIITIVSCVLSVDIFLDICLWSGLIEWNKSTRCVEFFLWAFSLLTYFAKFWVLPFCLFCGCHTLRKQVKGIFCCCCCNNTQPDTQPDRNTESDRNTTIRSEDSAQLI